MAALKILVCGDVEGNFKDLFRKIGIYNTKKGPFEYLFCVGSFFGHKNDDWEDVLNGKILVPLTTYILGPNKPEHVKYYSKLKQTTSGLADNIVYLGKRGIFKVASGAQIAYLSGVENTANSAISFNKNDVQELVTLVSNIPIDILLTSEWPRNVTNHAKQLEDQNAENIGSRAIAHLAKNIKPRYHFSGLQNLYYERLPYRNHQVLLEKSSPPTRFIGLASINNDKKLKWIYAFNMVPRCSMTVKELTNVSGVVTECPYDVEDYKDQFFFATDKSKYSENKNLKNKTKKSGDMKLGSEVNCWFCLRNTGIEKQLLISIGEHSYVTLAKGGIVKDHLLIIPLKHVNSFAILPESAQQEVYRYKEALAKYFNCFDKDVVFFERSFKSPHFQIQVVPVPKSKSHACKDVIIKHGMKNELEFTELSYYTLLKQVIPDKASYCYFEIVINKKIHDKLIHIIKKEFPLQFGRMVLACEDVLNKPDRVDWKSCNVIPDVEKETAEGIRNKFKEYDPTYI